MREEPCEKTGATCQSFDYQVSCSAWLECTWGLRKADCKSFEEKIHHPRHVKNKVELRPSEMFPRSVQSCVL